MGESKMSLGIAREAAAARAQAPHGDDRVGRLPGRSGGTLLRDSALPDWRWFSSSACMRTSTRSGSARRSWWSCSASDARRRIDGLVHALRLARRRLLAETEFASPRSTRPFVLADRAGAAQAAGSRRRPWPSWPVSTIPRSRSSSSSVTTTRKRTGSPSMRPVTTRASASSSTATTRRTSRRR
jgi:hypothetical protein